MNEKNLTIETMPMLALRGVSAFPNMILNIDVERPISISALDKAMSGDRKIFLLAQRSPRVELPKQQDLYTIGTICVIKQILRIPNDGIRVMVEGLNRARLLEMVSEKPHFTVKLERLSESRPTRISGKTEAMLRQCYGLYSRYLELTSNPSPEAIAALALSNDPGYVADFIAQNIHLRHPEKQQLLEELYPSKRLEKINKILQRELEVLEIEQQLRQKTQERMMQTHRENILREQLKTIKSELGEGSDEIAELDEYRERIERLRLRKR